VFYEAAETDCVPSLDVGVTDPDGAAVPVVGYGPGDGGCGGDCAVVLFASIGAGRLGDDLDSRAAVDAALPTPNVPLGRITKPAEGPDWG